MTPEPNPTSVSVPAEEIVSYGSFDGYADDPGGGHFSHSLGHRNVSNADCRIFSRITAFRRISALPAPVEVSASC